jgi:hypothetical protein
VQMCNSILALVGRLHGLYCSTVLPHIHPQVSPRWYSRGLCSNHRDLAALLNVSLALHRPRASRSKQPCGRNSGESVQETNSTVTSSQYPGSASTTVGDDLSVSRVGHEAKRCDTDLLGADIHIIFFDVYAGGTSSMTVRTCLTLCCRRQSLVDQIHSICMKIDAGFLTDDSSRSSTNQLPVYLGDGCRLPTLSRRIGYSLWELTIRNTVGEVEGCGLCSILDRNNASTGTSKPSKRSSLSM